jgi:Glycosyltransferase family 87
VSSLADTAPSTRHTAEMGRLSRYRAAGALHPHLALLGVVCVALATEPAVQAGRDASSNLEYVGAALGLLARATIALVCLFVAWEGQKRLRLAPVLGCALLLGAGWLALHLLIGVEPDQDLTFYGQDGAAVLDGTYPRSEYPTGAVALFALETWLGGEPPHVLHAATMLGFHLVAVAAIWSVGTRWSAWLAAFVAVWPLNLFHWELRYDLAPTAFLVVGLVLALRERWALGGVALGIGAALKWSPALALVPLVAWLLARRDGRSAGSLTAGFALAFAALTLPFLVWDASNVLGAYELQGDRGVTGESVWYLPLAVLGLATAGPNPSDDAGVGAGSNVVATLAQVILVVALVFLAVRVRSRSHAVALGALAPAAFLLTNRVFSSQFLVLLVAVWALAAALVVASEREQLAAGLVMAGATSANALVHPYTVPVAWQLASAAMFVLAIGLTLWLVFDAARPRAAGEPP